MRCCARREKLKKPRFVLGTRKARVFFEEIDEIPDDHELVHRKPAGFTWYEMGS